MHSHHIALALADARITDVQRAATHTTATVPLRGRRRHLRASALLGLAATATLAAVAPTGAFAQPVHEAGTLANVHAGETSAPAARAHLSPSQIDAADHARAIRMLNHNLTRHDVSIVAPQGRPAPRVTSVAVSDGGFDWADAGIGAGLTAALLLGAAGVASVRRAPTTTAQ